MSAFSIKRFDKSVDIEFSDPTNLRPTEWFASVHLSPSVRLQRLVGRYDTLYVTQA